MNGKTPLLEKTVFLIGMAVLAWTALEILSLRKDVVRIETTEENLRFSAKEGSDQAERIKVLEVKINVINGIVRDIRAIREDVQTMDNRLIRISTHMKLEEK